ncbi:hypothetical protein FACS189426_13070 [Bacteroidia bacterium]|nr:hypothetical protein FACS189426_13070 [Bacteroidia bacterium]GHT84614.1 hypothetical protein FACS18947_2300 [Bacteroidia bacterium]
MRKVIFTLTLLGGLFFAANSVSAKGIIFYSYGEKIEVAQKLPPEATVNEGEEHVNLGVMYEQFSIFWIPMWNYGETKYVLINDEKDTYYDLDAEDITMLKTDFNIDFPQKPTIGFWNKIGGKIIWGAVILAAIFGWWTTRKDNDDDEAEIPNQAE